MKDPIDKINKKATPNLKELLKSDAPYIVEDGKVNLEKLKGLLAGETTEKEDDRFYFNWAGKDKVFQAIQAPAYSTLVPQKNKSIGWDETENLMIVGENLETLKLLLKPYFGKVKVIYVDPPYNTGNDFIYKDNFSLPLKEYFERTGQKDGNGSRMTTNSEANGRFHSDWLNFMFTRLFLARNLLTDDGIIYISIDDKEVHHLRMLMDEVFGEDNFLTMFLWKSRQTTDSRKDTHTSTDHEYIISYCKNISNFSAKGSPIDVTKYSNPDNDPRGDWASIDLSVQATKDQRPNQFYDIVDPNTGNKYPANPNRVWSKSRAVVEQMIKEKRILFPESGNGRPREKKFIADLKSGITGFSSWLDSTKVGYTTNGTRELSELFEGRIFDFPKPTSLLKTIFNQSLGKDDLIMDFFAGSGSTGHAVAQLNKEDGGNRKFILVQIPEPTDEISEAFRAGYKSISDVCIERLKRVSKKVENSLKFKVFSLSSSNFNLKDEFELAENKDLGELKNTYLKELGLYVDQPTVIAANTLDIVYEIILKNGFSLNSKIDELKLGSNNFYKVTDAENELEIHVSLDSKIEDVSVEVIRTTEYKGKTFVFYDNALTDSQKINLNTFVKLQVI
ncbi:MAG TPA: site-specific DNA-methyltransferase [Candidatus Levybacteria bacterium]|nr:site-specific DNA-methyltransferase [Candidatus Levybacteria bacterium]